MAAAGFDSEVEVLKRLQQDLSYALNERDQLRRSGGNLVDVSGRIRGLLTRQKRQLEAVQASQRASEGAAGISAREQQRRRDLMRALQTESTRLQDLERSAGPSTDRDALLGAPVGGVKSYAAAGGSAAAGGGATAPARPTAEHLQAQVERDHKAQDEILESMSRGLDGLKTMGLAIGDETDLHMRLMDDIEEEVDKGDAALKRETARAEHITRDTRTCWLYVAICLLLGVLIALVAYRWS